VKTLLNLVLDGSKDLMKQSKALETSFKQTQDEAKLNLKPTPKGKKDRTKVQHKRGKHLQKQSSLASLKNKTSMRVNTLDMP
jgi:hypothetical protein